MFTSDLFNLTPSIRNKADLTSQSISSAPNNQNRNRVLRMARCLPTSPYAVPMHLQKNRTSTDNKAPIETTFKTAYIQGFCLGESSLNTNGADGVIIGGTLGEHFMSCDEHVMHSEYPINSFTSIKVTANTGGNSTDAAHATKHGLAVGICAYPFYGKEGITVKSGNYDEKHYSKWDHDGIANKDVWQVLDEDFIGMHAAIHINSYYPKRPITNWSNDEGIYAHFEDVPSGTGQHIPAHVIGPSQHIPPRVMRYLRWDDDAIDVWQVIDQDPIVMHAALHENHYYAKRPITNWSNDEGMLDHFPKFSSGTGQDIPPRVMRDNANFEGGKNEKYCLGVEMMTRIIIFKVGP